MARKSSTANEAGSKVTATGHTTSTALPASPQTRLGKRARLVAMLGAPEGATISEVGAALLWQPHTVRAALSSLRKSGTAIERITPASAGDASRYRIAQMAESGA